MRALRLAFLLTLSVLAFPTRAQIANGSFEQGGVYTDAGWTFPGVTAPNSPCRWPLDDPAPGGGTWAIAIPRRNHFGPCWVVAAQAVPAVQSGDVWRATAWARVPADCPPGWCTARLYWTDYRPAYDPTPFPYSYPGPVGDAASTTSSEWTLLVAVDTLSLAPGDSAGVVLDPGWGPNAEFPWDWRAYDLVSAERLFPVGTEPSPAPAAPPLTAWPSPFRTSAEIRIALPEPAPARLALYDMLGREVAVLLDRPLPAGEHRVRLDGSALTPGLYLLRLTAGGVAAAHLVVRTR